MNPCKLREPKVIDNDLLYKCIKEHGPKGEAGRLADLEGVPLEEVEQIRLEFKNILKIDHLWVLTSLTRLSLNNNLLEQIENLDSLVNLVDLDLSFNKISKIQNLEALTKIEKLSFFDNLISVMENMDGMTKLTVFSIGRNRIEEIENVSYLRQFKNLKSLNLVENPCAEDEDFRLYVAVFLPQVVYYQYRLVTDTEKEQGHKKFKVKLRALHDKEARDVERREKEAQELADAELHSKSFVEYLNSGQLFELLFAEDVDGKALLEVGDDAKEFYDEYEEQFNESCRQIFEVGQKQYLVRQEELDQFVQCVATAKKDNQDDSIKHMEAFIEQKGKIFAEIKRMQESLNEENLKYEVYIEQLDLTAEDYDKLLHDVWKVLMKLEMDLYEQMEEINQNFEHSMTELVNVFIEAAQGILSQIRSLEVTYSENVGECALRFQTAVNMGEDIVVPTVLQPMMEDKDVLHNCIATSHDVHMQIIDNREDTLVNKTRKWLSDLVDNLSRDEMRRNRDKILEINTFLDLQREEFEDLVGEYGADVDPEVTAVLE